MKLTRTQLKEIIREELQRLDERWRRRRSYYSKDPRWIKAKYAGVDASGNPFKRGEEVLYYPATKKFYTGKEADEAWRDFTSAAQDDAWMDSQFPNYR